MAFALLGALGALGGAFGAYRSAKEQRRAAEATAAGNVKAAELGLQGLREGMAAQEATTREGLAQQAQLFERGLGAQQGFTDQSVSALREFYDQAMQQYAPFQAAGQTALQNLNAQRKGGVSDLFRLQQEETENAINRQAAKRGMFSSPASLQIQADAARKISAEEAERQFNREFSIAQLGSGFSQLAGQAAQGTGSGISNVFANAAGRTGGMFSGQQSAIGSAFNQLAQAKGRAGQIQGQLMGQGAQAGAAGQAAGPTANAGFFNTLGGIFASAPNYMSPQVGVQPIQRTPYRPANINMQGFSPNFSNLTLGGY